MKKLFKHRFRPLSLIPFLSLLMVFTLISCGEIRAKGDIDTKEIPLEDFSKLDLQGHYRIFYVKSDSTFLTVETYPNIAENLSISVKDRQLSIKEKRPAPNIDFYSLTLYSALNPEKITASDGVDLNLSSEINTDVFSLILKKNAKFIGSVTSRRAEVQMEGKTRANFRGTSQRAKLDIKDTASVIAPYWALKSLKINAANGSYSELQVADSISGVVKNTAGFVYFGDPIRAFKIDPKARVENRKLN